MQNPHSFILVTTMQLPFKPFIQTRNKKGLLKNLGVIGSSFLSLCVRGFATC